MTRERKRGHASAPIATTSKRAAGRTGLATMAIPIALLVLLLWLIGTLLEGPGWIHGLLTAGIFLLIYGIVVRGTPPPLA